MLMMAQCYEKHVQTYLYTFQILYVKFHKSPWSNEIIYRHNVWHYIRELKMCHFSKIGKKDINGCFEWETTLDCTVCIQWSDETWVKTKEVQFIIYWLLSTNCTLWGIFELTVTFPTNCTSINIFIWSLVFSNVW